VHRGMLFPLDPAVVVAGASVDDGLARIEGRRLVIAPALGEEAGLNAVIGLTNDQQLAAELLENHGASGGVRSQKTPDRHAKAWFGCTHRASDSLGRVGEVANPTPRLAHTLLTPEF